MRQMSFFSSTIPMQKLTFIHIYIYNAPTIDRKGRHWNLTNYYFLYEMLQCKAYRYSTNWFYKGLCEQSNIALEHNNIICK